MQQQYAIARVIGGKILAYKCAAYPGMPFARFMENCMPQSHQQMGGCSKFDGEDCVSCHPTLWNYMGMCVPNQAANCFQPRYNTRCSECNTGFFNFNEDCYQREPDNIKNDNI